MPSSSAAMAAHGETSPELNLQPVPSRLLSLLLPLGWLCSAALWEQHAGLWVTCALL